MSAKTAPAWTPGPWQVVRPVTPTDGFTLWSGEDRVALTGPATSLECEAANARLIAAAPDLAEALETIVREIDESVTLKALARAALARARGGGVMLAAKWVQCPECKERGRIDVIHFPRDRQCTCLACGHVWSEK